MPPSAREPEADRVRSDQFAFEGLLTRSGSWTYLVETFRCKFSYPPTPGRIVLARMVLDGVDDLLNAIAALAGTAAERKLSGKARPRPWKSC